MLEQSGTDDRDIVEPRNGEHRRFGKPRISAAELEKMQERCEAFGAERQRDADDDLIKRETDAEQCHQCGDGHTADGAGDEAKRKQIPGVGGDKAAIGAGEHHAFDADVEYPGLLGDLLAKPGEQQRYARGDGTEQQRTEERFGEERAHAVYAFVSRRRR